MYVAGSLSMSGAVVTNNTARSHGGGVNAGGNATVTNVEFTGNECTQTGCGGGGLYVGGLLNLTGGEFDDNSSTDDGGGAYAFAGSSLSGGTFRLNQCSNANCQGGGLYSGGPTTVVGTNFLTNTAQDDGGGLFAGGSVTVTTGRFEGNACDDDNCQGGGLFALNGLRASNTNFFSNTARFSGGGVYANAGAQHTVAGGLFQGNRCTQTGCRAGGFDAQGDATVQGVQFIDNQATFNGGGMNASARLTMTASVFQFNEATVGAGLYVWGNGGQVVNTLFADNVAVNSGAAIYVHDTDALFSVVHTTIGMGTGRNNTSAVEIQAGSVGVTNTIVAMYDWAIVNVGGSVYQDYNLFYEIPFITTGSVGGGTHSLTGDPFFWSPASGNYHLLPGSRARDTGVNGGVSVDFEGDARPFGGGFDMGYDEAEFNLLYLPLIMR
jgi:hypothetical protein